MIGVANYDVKCVHIKTAVTFRSSTTNQEFRVKATTDCIECAKCSIQYVEETENAL